MFRLRWVAIIATLNVAFACSEQPTSSVAASAQYEAADEENDRPIGEWPSLSAVRKVDLIKSSLATSSLAEVSPEKVSSCVDFQAAQPDADSTMQIEIAYCATKVAENNDWTKSKTPISDRLEKVWGGPIQAWSDESDQNKYFLLTSAVTVLAMQSGATDMNGEARDQIVDLYKNCMNAKALSRSFKTVSETFRQCVSETP